MAASAQDGMGMARRRSAGGKTGELGDGAPRAKRGSGAGSFLIKY